MDGSVTTAIILIFVFSILGSVTGKHPAASRAGIPQSNEQSYDNSQTYSTVDVTTIPSIGYADGYSEGLSAKLKKFILGYAKKIDDWEAQTIADSIAKYSQSCDVNPKLVCALIARESGFNRFAVSSSGAQGLGQLLPSTATGLKVSDPFDIDQNVSGTTRYIRSMLDRFSGPNKVPFALGAYAEGPNQVKNDGGFKAPAKKYIEDILNITNRI